MAGSPLQLLRMKFRENTVTCEKIDRMYDEQSVFTGLWLASHE